MIYRPSDFITHLDENLQVSKYKPELLIGTSINTKRVTAENIDLYTEIFLKPNEKKISFQKTIRDSMSYPDNFELITITKEEQLLAFIAFNRVSKDKLEIPIFRFLNNSLKVTLIKHMLFKSILTAINEKRTHIEIQEKQLEGDITSVIQEARFVKINNIWEKINIKSVLDIKELLSKVETQSGIKSILTKVNEKLKATGNNSEFVIKYNYERHLSPLKIIDLEIPTYIVPIKPQWAEQLFNDKSNEKLNLFEPKYELLLNRENVYYRSSSPNILQAPARILWYSSGNKSTKTGGSIIASSYIDEVFVDRPKTLFKQFEKLGIYTWKDLSKTAGNKDKIMAFVFSDTELFHKPISLKRINDVFENLENKSFMIVAPLKIKTELTLPFTKKG